MSILKMSSRTSAAQLRNAPNMPRSKSSRKEPIQRVMNRVLVQDLIDNVVKAVLEHLIGVTTV